MLKVMFKPFAVMVMGVFALTFLVSTATNINTFAATSDFAHITLTDNSSTKELNLCVNNSFVDLKNGEYAVNPGKTDIKIYYGKLDTKGTCDNKYIQFQRVFNVTVDLKAEQTYAITASGKAELTGVIKHYKTVLVKESEIDKDNENHSIISWKNVDKSDLTNKDRICVNKKIVKEDKLGSRQAVIKSGSYKFSFEYDQDGMLCNPILPLSEGHTLELEIGCKEGMLYELGVERDDDYSKAYYQGLSFNTKSNNKEEVVAPVKPISSTPVTPTPSTLVPTQTVTVRSGGGNEWLAIPTLLSVGGIGFVTLKSKKLKI